MGSAAGVMACVVASAAVALVRRICTKYCVSDQPSNPLARRLYVLLVPVHRFWQE